MDGNRDMDPARADVASCCIENGIELDADDLGYEIMIGYERDGSTDELPQAVAEELSIGCPHTSNWPCFGIESLDYIRTLEWTVRSLPEFPEKICHRF